jgi:hypothetical protein
MQNSYDVAALTKNDMVNRSLKRAPGKVKATTPEQPIFPGLEGRYTYQDDGSILVHQRVYTTEGGTVITLTEFTIVREGSTVSISGGSKVFGSGLAVSDDEDDYSSDDDEEEEEEEEEMSWEVEFQHLMDNLVL